jgi:hypothetical protein
MKKIQYAVIYTFVTILALLVVFSLFIDSDGFSPFENRYLSKKPVLTASDFFSGKYMDRYETFLLDNFLLRDLSVIGFQSYANLLYLDLFTGSELVLADVDVDEFVRAGGREGIIDTTAGDTTAGEMPDNGTGEGDGLPSGKGRNGDAPLSSDFGQSTAGGNGVQAGGQAAQARGYAAQAGGQDAAAQQAGQAAEEGLTAGQSSGNGSGEGNIPVDNDSAPAGEGKAPATGGNASASEGNVPAADTDESLTNSLIIAGDRVMMPTGAYNLKPFGEILSEFAETMPDLRLYSITGPTSAAFYASKKYSTGGYDQSKAETIIAENAGGVTVVKVFDRLREHKNEHIYFRSDVHWTALGAYYAYTAFCEASGQEAADIDEDFTKGTYEPFLGGLYSQIYKMPQASRLKNNPEKLDYYIPKIGYQLTLCKMGNLKNSYKVDSIINTDFKSLGAYKYSCFAWGDQRIERIDTDNPNGRKLLVIKDSYGSAVIPFLVHNYSLIYVMDPKGFNNEGGPVFDAKDLINEEGIEDVLFCFSIYGSGRKIIRDSLESLLLR